MQTDQASKVTNCLTLVFVYLTKNKIIKYYFLFSFAPHLFPFRKPPRIAPHTRFQLEETGNLSHKHKHTKRVATKSYPRRRAASRNAPLKRPQRRMTDIFYFGGPP